jgi:hypothetical protein
MNGMKPGGIPFKQVDIRRNTAVYGQLVRTIHPGCIFQKSNCRRNYNGSQHQSQRPLPIRFQKRISVRSRRYDCRNASHCGNKGFHSAIEKRGQLQMTFVRNQPGALIGIEKGIAYQSRADLLEKPEIISLFKGRIDTLQQLFAHYEQIKRFTLLPEPFSMERGELTNTLKLRRAVISRNYKEQIDKMYEE